MAQHHTAKAGGIERQLETTIFSDDPDAIEAIQEKIAKLEKWQEATKQVNRLVRKGDREGLAALGLSPAAVAALFVPDFAGRVGVPGYALTNNNANIRRLRERIKEIQHRQTLTQTAVAAGGCVIVGKWDYVNVIFSEKPDRSIIEALKAAGFHWGSGRWCGKRDQLPECVLQQAGTIEPESPSETGGAS